MIYPTNNIFCADYAKIQRPHSIFLSTLEDDKDEHGDEPEPNDQSEIGSTKSRNLIVETQSSFAFSARGISRLQSYSNDVPKSLLGEDCAADVQAINGGDSIKYGSDISSEITCNETDDNLHSAVRGNKARLLRFLLESRQFGINSRDQNNNTPLHIGCIYGNSDCVDVLLRWKGVLIGVKNNAGLSPFECALKYGHVSCVRLLLQSRLFYSSMTTEDYVFAWELVLSLNISLQDEITIAFNEFSFPSFSDVDFFKKNSCVMYPSDDSRSENDARCDDFPDDEKIIIAEDIDTTSADSENLKLFLLEFDENGFMDSL